MSGKPQTDEYLLERARQRFMNNFIPEPNTGCWLWIAGAHYRKDGSPRPVFTFPRTRRGDTASRVAWELFKGPIPTGMHVLHTCDVPMCVNFENHLYLGTHTQNMQDAKNRKRRWCDYDPVGSTEHCRKIAKLAPRGENNPAAKLTWSDVIEIRASTERLHSLAARYDVSYSLIWLIRKNRIWQVPK